MMVISLPTLTTLLFSNLFGGLCFKFLDFKLSEYDNYYST